MPLTSSLEAWWGSCRSIHLPYLFGKVWRRPLHLNCEDGVASRLIIPLLFLYKLRFNFPLNNEVLTANNTFAIAGFRSYELQWLDL